jgi:hypothetical protein
MNVVDFDGLADVERAKITEHIKRAITVAIGGYAEHSENVKRTINEVVKGLIKLNQGSADIRAYVDARKNVETTAKKTRDLLWKIFRDSTGLSE